ncbi:kinase-like domain-containing protein [Bisporella sp. PMI_857]|nr:kinase-like domain-containing protein [Bisporella sp. PMI_857]
MVDPVNEAAEQRRGFIRNLLDTKYGRQVSECKTLGRDSNNYVYHVTLLPFTSEFAPPTKENLEHGTVKLPEGINEAVIRISNTTVALDETVRTENEVAAITLFQRALSNNSTRIIPLVYGWSPASSLTGYAYILQQHLPGISIEHTFKDLSLTQKREVLNCVAKVLRQIQDYELPKSVEGYGGLGFDEKGQVITGPLTVGFGGPWNDWKGMYLGKYEAQLRNLDTVGFLGGWRENGLRDRLEAFFHSENGVLKLLDEFKLTSPTAVHGDFDLQNILFDKDTLEITALLDFEFSHIGSPLDEYFWSFNSIHGLLPGLEHDEAAMRAALLSAFSSSRSTYIAGSPFPEKIRTDYDWEVARTWDEELGREGAKKSSNILGAGDVAAVYWFIENICLPRFLSEKAMKRTSEEDKLRLKREISEVLDMCLKFWGF